MARDGREKVDLISSEDHERIGKLLLEIGGKNVSWGAQAHLDVWLAESRMESERRASQRLWVATWALVVATLGLVAATVGLIYTG